VNESVLNWTQVHQLHCKTQLHKTVKYSTIFEGKVRPHSKVSPQLDSKLPENVTRTNTLAYFNPLVTKKEGLILLTPGAIVIKLFTAVVYEFS